MRKLEIGIQFFFKNLNILVAGGPQKTLSTFFTLFTSLVLWFKITKLHFQVYSSLFKLDKAVTDLVAKNRFFLHIRWSDFTKLLCMLLLELFSKCATTRKVLAKALQAINQIELGKRSP